MSEQARPIAIVQRQVHGSTGEDLGDVLYVQCPGCKSLHGPCIRRGVNERPVWEWNGDLEHPTLNPSILVTYGGRSQDMRCHSYLRDGVWEFLSDSTHDLAGQHVPLPPLPGWVIVEDH